MFWCLSLGSIEFQNNVNEFVPENMRFCSNNKNVKSNSISHLIEASIYC